MPEKMHYAYCWGNGVIRYAGRKLDGALVFAYGPLKVIQGATEAEAKRRFDGNYVVPGVAETDDTDKKIAAVDAFNTKLLQRATMFNLDVKLIGAADHGQ